MAGVTGREVTAAYARSNTWGTAASVTKQILIASTNDFDQAVGLVDDESFNQDFLGVAEVGDFVPMKSELAMQARFEHMDCLLAMACGSVAAPTVVSSVAANSLIAYSHAITLADELTHFLTLAVDTPQYTIEVPTAKLKGFTLRVGENGRMQISFPMVGAKVIYDSTVNINSTVYGATAATLGNRLFRKNLRPRMNIQTAAGLAAADNLTVLREFVFGYNRPMAEDDLVANQDYIIEPDDNGFPEFSLEMTFARMNTVTANSLAAGLSAGRVFKAEFMFSGPYINSTTQRSLKIEMPALQLYSFRAPFAGHDQVRPVGTFRLKNADAAPTGMTGTRPFNITLVNANSLMLLT